MRAVVQRVSRASVEVGGEVVASIGPGLLVLVGVARDDTEQQADALARKLVGLRVLSRGDSNDGGVLGDAVLGDAVPGDVGLVDLPRPEALVVSQFTLYGDTRRGRRPSWAAAAPGAQAEPLIARVVDGLRAAGVTVETGVFGAEMRVSLVNEGPMTVLVDV